MMNLYNAGSGKVRRINEESPKEAGAELSRQATQSKTTSIPRNNIPLNKNNAGIKNAVKKLEAFLPKNVNLEDILLLLIFLLLYLEKEDEELLIMLSVLLINDIGTG